MHMNRWRVGEDRGSKEMDGCVPLHSHHLLHLQLTDNPNTTQTLEYTKDKDKKMKSLS
jgi:hypothetical protein